MAPAPLHSEVCLGETQGRAFWVETSDGLRLRVGLWCAPAAKGTVFLFPGRTEYVEKYAQTADELAQRGLTTFAIDWRGQGLADRLLDDRRVGHVVRFTDYQKDVAAMMKAARRMSLPRPWYLLAHSMGGCIGLRAVMEKLPVQACAFTGPMWGIRIAPALRPVAFVVKHLAPALGFGHLTPPTTVPEPYVLNAPFEDNLLTRDREMWAMMRTQIERHPELSLGGPSIIWLREALSETAQLAARPSPGLPCVSYLGNNERIVRTDRIHERMERWPGGHLEMIEDTEHEVVMDSSAVRKRVFDDMVSRFSKATG